MTQQKNCTTNSYLTLDEEHGPGHEEGHDQGDQHHGGGVILEHLLEARLEAKHLDLMKIFQVCDSFRATEHEHIAVQVD